MVTWAFIIAAVSAYFVRHAICFAQVVKCGCIRHQFGVRWLQCTRSCYLDVPEDALCEDYHVDNLDILVA